MLLHRLAGLGSYAWKGNAHAYRYYYFHPCDNDGDPVGHPFDHQRAIPHPQPAYRYSDIHPYPNTHSYDHSHPCAFVDAIPAAHDNAYSQSNTDSTNRHLHVFPGAANAYFYASAANSDLYILTGAADGNIYILTGATKRNPYRDSYGHAYVGGTITFPFKIAQTHA